MNKFTSDIKVPVFKNKVVCRLTAGAGMNAVEHSNKVSGQTESLT